MAAWRTGRLDSIGFSVDAVIGARPRGSGALRALEVEEIVAIYSIDMVRAASSGGRTLRMLEPDGSRSNLPPECVPGLLSQMEVTESARWWYDSVELPGPRKEKQSRRGLFYRGAEDCS